MKKINENGSLKILLHGYDGDVSTRTIVNKNTQDSCTNKNMFGEAIIAVFVHVANKQTWVGLVLFQSVQRRMDGITTK